MMMKMGRLMILNFQGKYKKNKLPGIFIVFLKTKEKCPHDCRHFIAEIYQ